MTAGAFLGERLEKRALFAGISVADVVVTENDAGTSTASFTVTLSAPDLAPVTVQYATADGSATAGTDYTAATGTLTFDPNATQLTVAVPVAGDVTAEDDETFTLTLSAAAGATIDDATATATIHDSDETGGIEAADDLFAATPGQPVALDVLSNDLGLAGTTPAVTIVGEPVGGTATVNPDNTVTFTAAGGAGAVDTFTYRVASGAERNDAVVRVMNTGAFTGGDGNGSSLYVAGDAGNNAFAFRRRPGGQVQVLIDKVDRGTFPAPTAGVFICGGDGNDKLSAAGLRNLPVHLYGGAGDDAITGGRLDDVLVGGDGNDAINGGAGRDYLAGGRGADRLTGATGEDILVAGPTDFDADFQDASGALRDLLAVWTGPGAFAARLAAIQSADGIGTNGATLNGSTLLDDADVDTIAGVFNQDALFANTAGGTAPDVLKGKRIGGGTGIGLVTDVADWAPSNVTRVSVSSQQIGVTPLHVGFNQGYYLPGSSTSGWVDYSQLNAFRVWTSPGDFEPDNSDTFGDGIATLADFEARKAAVRANPENNGFIPWEIYNDRFENLEITGRNTSKLNYMLGELTARGVSVIMQITRSESYPFNGWDGAYEQWQHFYAMAYHVAKNYDVTKFQMYNEPDQTNATTTQDEWRQRLKLASDAVRSAIEDVNRDFGKSLVPDVSAPVVKLGAESVLTWDTPGSVDWGKQALLENRTDYAGRNVNYDIFNTYDMHRYADSRPLSWYEDDGEILRSEIPQYNASGQMMPFTYTEYNRRSTAGFNNRPAESLDTPQMYTEFGLINLLTMSQDVQGLYAFKFNQTDFSGSPQKTGFYYVSEEGLLDTTGATRAAGVQRLFAKGFKGQKPRVAVADSNANYEAGASFDSATNTYSYFGTNLSDTDAATMTFDLSGWNVPAGEVVTIEEVSERHHGEVVQTVTVPASDKITVTQPARSVWLLSVPAGNAAQTAQAFTATEDAQVHNGDAATAGADMTTRVARDASGPAGDHATYLKFDLGAITADDAGRAVVQVTGRNATSADPAILHVYALTDDAWSESSVTWATAPNLLGAADAKVSDVGVTATPVGHLTFDGTPSTSGIDVTEYLRGHADGMLTLLIVREQRFTGDADANVVEISTRESLSPPRLTVFT